MKVEVNWSSLIDEVFTVMQKNNEIRKFDIPPYVKADWIANLEKWHIHLKNYIETVPVIKAFIIGFYHGRRQR